MKSKSLARVRSAASHRQQGRCFYCTLPMWQTDAQAFASEYRITVAQARQFKCTAEHLVARQDGGSDAQENIVAACWHCNRLRHRRKDPPAPVQYKELVCAKLRKGLWHPQPVLQQFMRR